jgi:pyruvate/2-oxoglutarate/acetoin dehydrogenase E1 component
VASKDVPMPFAPSLESAIVPAAADIEKAIRDVVA